jgi:hypothetical protein
MSSIRNQVTAIQQALDRKIDGARAYVASDFVHCWEILLNKPGTCKIAILFEDEKARVNFAGGDITGRVNRYIDVMISRGRGLKDIRADNLTVGAGDGRPLFDLAEEMRDVLRLIRFNPVTDEVPDYIGLGRWGKDEGFNLDAFKCSIWIGTQINLPVTENGANVSTII